MAFVYVADVYLCAVLICSLGLLSIFLFTLILTCQYFHRRHRLKGRSVASLPVHFLFEYLEYNILFIFLYHPQPVTFWSSVQKAGTARPTFKASFIKYIHTYTSIVRLQLWHTGLSCRMQLWRDGNQLQQLLQLLPKNPEERHKEEN